MINHVKEDYITSKLNEEKQDPKRFWRSLAHVPPGHVPLGQIHPKQIRLAQTFETETKKRSFTLLH